MNALYKEMSRDSITATIMGGKEVEVKLADVVKAYRPNAMNLVDKIILLYYDFLGISSPMTQEKAIHRRRYFPSDFWHSTYSNADVGGSHAIRSYCSYLFTRICQARLS